MDGRLVVARHQPVRDRGRGPRRSGASSLTMWPRKLGSSRPPTISVSDSTGAWRTGRRCARPSPTGTPEPYVSTTAICRMTRSLSRMASAQKSWKDSAQSPACSRKARPAATSAERGVRCAGLAGEHQRRHARQLLERTVECGLVGPVRLLGGGLVAPRRRGPPGRWLSGSGVGGRRGRLVLAGHASRFADGGRCAKADSSRPLGETCGKMATEAQCIWRIRCNAIRRLFDQLALVFAPEKA